MALTQSRYQPGTLRSSQRRQAPLTGIGMASGSQALMAGRLSARRIPRPAGGQR